MDTDEHRSDGPEAHLTYDIIGCAMEVLNEVGHGFHEKPYENALTRELTLRQIAFQQQPRYELGYKGAVIGEFVPDLVVAAAVVVDAKVIDKITDHERGQMLNYLKTTKHRVGLIINFKRSRLEWERVVL